MIRNVIPYPKLPKAFASFGLDFGAFKLVDVGCKGGIDRAWFTLGSSLKAIGFDPLVEEIEYLERKNSNNNIIYKNGFIVSSINDGQNSDPIYSGLCERSSFSLACKIANYNSQHFSADSKLLMSQNRWKLDEALENFNFSDPDFIKVDTNGHNFNVLQGALSSLKNAIGVLVKVQFHGAATSESCTFSNIDNFMRSQGYTLFDLEAHRYSKGALPTPFIHDIFAQTVSGQILWGDALYLKDMVSQPINKKTPSTLTPEKVLKLAFLFEFFKLSDCAAELLQEKKGFLGINNDQLTALLDVLTLNLPWGRCSYDQYFSKFCKNPFSFLQAEAKVKKCTNSIKKFFRIK